MLNKECKHISIKLYFRAFLKLCDIKVRLFLSETILNNKFYNPLQMFMPPGERR